MKKKEFADFITEICKDKGLSLRGLSKNAGLSPGTLHSIINRGHEPSLYSLNQLADYLGVRRQYLWKMAGLLRDEDLDDKSAHPDPRMGYYLEKLNSLPESARELFLHIIEDIVNYHNGFTEFHKSKK